MNPGKKQIVVEICMGVNCTFRGAGSLLQMLSSDEGLSSFCKVQELSCFKDRCDHAYKSPIVRIDETYYENASPERIFDALYTRIDGIMRKEP